MDMIGHCVTAEMSGCFKEEEIFGPSISELMFLNYTHSHDWAYRNCWDPSGYGELEPTVRLIRAHMICDWVIHYGPGTQETKTKRGWAYRRMMLAGRLRERFFTRAWERDYLLEGRVDLSSWSKKQRLDFDHSLVEYAVDLILAPRAVTPKRFAAIQDGLSRLCGEAGYGGRTWAWDLFRRLRAGSDRDRGFIEGAMIQLGRDAVESKTPEEFAVRTAIQKYGLKLDEETVSYVREVLAEIADQIDRSELKVLLSTIAETVRTEPVRARMNG